MFRGDAQLGGQVRGSPAKFSPLPTACMIPRPCRAWSPPNPSSLSPIPSKTHTHDVIGSLYVLDTRPLQTTERQIEMLLWIAEVVITPSNSRKQSTSRPSPGNRHLRWIGAYQAISPSFPLNPCRSSSRMRFVCRLFWCQCVDMPCKRRYPFDQRIADVVIRMLIETQWRPTLARSSFLPVTADPPFRRGARPFSAVLQQRTAWPVH